MSQVSAFFSISAVIGVYREPDVEKEEKEMRDRKPMHWKEFEKNLQEQRSAYCLHRSAYLLR